MTHSMHEIFRQTVTRAGGQSAFARAVGASQQVISYRLARGLPIPAELVLSTEKAFGVPRQQLRPDIYPEA